MRRRHRVAGQVPERPAAAVGPPEVEHAVAGQQPRLRPRIVRPQPHRHHRALDRHRAPGMEADRGRLLGQVHQEPASRRVRVQRLAEGEPHRPPPSTFAPQQPGRLGIVRRGVAGARYRPPDSRQSTLCAASWGEARMRQRRRRPRRRRADAAAMERQRVPEHRDAPRRVVRPPPPRARTPASPCPSPAHTPPASRPNSPGPCRWRAAARRSHPPPR